MSMVRIIVGGVDTHADQHVVAAIDANGGVVGTEAFPAASAGYEALLGWLASHGEPEQRGVPPRRWNISSVPGAPIYMCRYAWPFTDLDRQT